MPTAADRNLLFGILALHLDFIDRDQLVNAMNVWVTKKNQELGHILVVQGVLTSDRQVLLKALVEEHLKQHSQDMQKSLAAVGSMAPVKKDLEKIKDSEVQASLVQIPGGTAKEEGDAWDPFTTSQETPESPNHVRYRILRPHAKGGIGQVFVAQDLELNREVALKEIQPHHAHNASSRSRFLLEAEITGGLEHPGIVPVYGLGQYGDGRPFYAMRFIRGDSLQDAIEKYHREGVGTPRDPGQRSLELRQLLGRFIDVCNAVSFAHSRGVLHRDLKPGNVMLGKYGETLVVDWGLAKAVDRPEEIPSSGETPLRPSSGSGSAETLPGTALGTPAFMSPEQAAGRLASLGPSSDVYSLGATLYCLLCGRPPFDETDLGKMLQKIQSGNFLPPRNMKPSVPAPLEAICLKAMANETADRYPSPDALANDIEQWLADEPVSAYRESRFQRLARWARRNRSWTRAAAAALIASSLVATLAALWSAQLAHREHQARVIAEDMRERGLRLAVQFAARTVASEIDLRWRILEAEAQNSQFLSLFNDVTGGDNPMDHPRRKALQDWIEARYQHFLPTTKATSWFLNNDQGLQLARAPLGDSIGKRWRFRDYFHGLGMDLSREEAKTVAPLSHVHRSTVFQSKVTKNLMVAFSVPVWDKPPLSPDRRVMGVLAMTVELGTFRVLQLGLSKEQLAVLVETRLDRVEGQPQKGLILHHPYMVDQRLKSPEDLDLPIFRLPGDRVRRLEKLRQASLRQWQDFENLTLKEQSISPNSDSLDRAYQDPVGDEYAGTWVAAFDPVLIPGRPDPINDAGWVVIVQERTQSRE